MNTINNNNSFNNISSSNILNINKKMELPKISQEHIPSQHHIDLNIVKNNDKNIKLNSKTVENKVCLSLSKKEGKNNIFIANKNNNNENQFIKKLLNDKISINISNSPLENKKNLFQRNIILKRYMNEALLYRKTLFQRKKIHVGKIFKLSSSLNKYYNNNIENLNKNLKTIDTSINSRSRKSGVTKQMKKYKTLDKNIELDNNIFIDYIKPNKKKMNCNLKYNYNKNQLKINEINTILNNFHEETKAAFAGYKNEAFKIIDKAYHKRE